MVNLFSLGKRLIQARLRVGFSQAEAARRLGTAAVTVYRWEHDLRTPSAATLFALSQLYQRPIEWFYDVESVDTATRIADGPVTYAPTDSAALEAELEPITLIAVNVIGAISAGGLVESWQEDLGQVEVPARIIRLAPNAFALKVSGNSLLSHGILEGDVVVVDPDADLVDGRIYAVRSEENHQTIAARRVYTVGDDRYKLVSGDGSVVEVDARRTRIFGRIRWSFSLREH